MQKWQIIPFSTVWSCKRLHWKLNLPARFPRKLLISRLCDCTPKRKPKRLWTASKGGAFVWESPPIPPTKCIWQNYTEFWITLSHCCWRSIFPQSVWQCRLTLPRKQQGCVCAVQGCVMGRLHSCPELSQDYKRIPFCWNKGLFQTQQRVNN